eukprot:15441241-Alexandrium_andersonii.AAC.1
MRHKPPPLQLNLLTLRGARGAAGRGRPALCFCARPSGAATPRAPPETPSRRNTAEDVRACPEMLGP